MASASHRSVNRIPDSDWAEVLACSDGQSLAVGHLKDVSEGGLSVELPVCLTSGIKVKVRLSTLTCDVLHH
ncbi:MAG: PilZ domain-containing protein, partial [Nitrospirota bacterium]